MQLILKVPWNILAFRNGPKGIRIGQLIGKSTVVQQVRTPSFSKATYLDPRWDLINLNHATGTRLVENCVWSLRRSENLAK